MHKKLLVLTILTLIWLILPVGAWVNCTPSNPSTGNSSWGASVGSFLNLCDNNQGSEFQKGSPPNGGWFHVYSTSASSNMRIRTASGWFQNYTINGNFASQCYAFNNWTGHTTDYFICPVSVTAGGFVNISGGNPSAWWGTSDIQFDGIEPPLEYAVRVVNTNIYTNQTLDPSNVSIYYNDGVSYVWYNETGTDGDIVSWDSTWSGQTLKVCSAALGFSEMCTNNFIPVGVTSTIIWQKLVPTGGLFPTPTPIGNVSTNITSKNLTEPLVLPNFMLINKSEFRDQITNNSIIGNYTYGITSFMDELGDAVNQTVQDSIEFIDVPFDFLIDIQAAAHNLYLALFIPLIPFTYLPLLVTTKVVAVIPWQIQSLISMGLLVDLFYLMIRGSGGS